MTRRLIQQSLLTIGIMGLILFAAGWLANFPWATGVGFGVFILAMIVGHVMKGGLE